VFDGKGALVASSAGDALFDAGGARLQRRSPRDSANPVIRAGFSALQAMRASRSRRHGGGRHQPAAPRRSADDALLMVQRPFGEALGLRWTLVVAAPESDFTGDIQRAFPPGGPGCHGAR
jgi:hypothetical protein